jgi:Flp pilus assembly protein TadG
MKRPTFLRRLPLIRSIRSARGQSLVEFTILLPVLLIMISGLIEFGFMLNFYLDVIDASREAARWAAGDDPLRTDITGTWSEPNTNFYGRVCTVANTSIDTGSGGQIDLDPASDDIVISGFAVSGGTVSARFPSGMPVGQFGWSCANPGGAGNHTSMFRTVPSLPPLKDINTLLSPSAPNTGVVMVEMWYDYHMILGLPWITAFVPDPVTLYAYSMMPNPNVEPTPTP